MTKICIANHIIMTLCQLRVDLATAFFFFFYHGCMNTYSDKINYVITG